MGRLAISPERLRGSDFDRQFRQRQRAYHRVDYIDIRPPNPQGRRPLMIIPSRLQSPGLWRPFSRFLYDQGRRHLVADFSLVNRRGGNHLVQNGAALLDIFEQAEDNGLFADYDSREERCYDNYDRGHRRIDVVAHGSGSLTAVYGASLGCYYFNSLVLVAPTGLAGPESRLRLAGTWAFDQCRRLARDLIDNPPASLAIGSQLIGQAVCHPRYTWHELRAISGTEISPALEYLRGQGTRVAILQMPADSLGRPEVTAAAGRSNPATSMPADAGRHLQSPSAGHYDLFINPDRTGQMVLDVVDNWPPPTRTDRHYSLGMKIRW